MRHAIDFLADHRWHLPPFAFWTPEEWKSRGPECDEIRRCMLGWDITDFNSGNFEKFGLFLFTIRNGNLEDPGTDKPYAEKIMIVREGQLTPMHFHFAKMEDIINRGGGNLMIELHNSTPEQTQADTPVNVSLDGVRKSVPAGSVVRLAPGESICLPPGLYHSFWAEPGAGTVLIGEVSTVNDDNTDNRFLQPLPRFSSIEEDEPPLHLLCNEYPPAPE
jgi:D-lyxose ketol-isomerase